MRRARWSRNLSCIGALHSPETGIIDGHRYMLALRGDLEDAGGAIAFNTPVTGAARKDGQWQVAFGGSDGGNFAFDAVVNCAGLGAQAVARAMEDYPATRVPRLVLAKGNYFTFAGRPAFSRLIYPTPIVGGLGVHVTLDLAGRMRFGPDVEWVERENYDVDPARAVLFYERIRTYWPGLPDGSLAPDYSGIRPKLTGPKEPQADFLIDAPAQHGLPGLVQMFGIESPGLTYRCRWARKWPAISKAERGDSRRYAYAGRRQRHRRYLSGARIGRHDLYFRQSVARLAWAARGRIATGAKSATLFFMPVNATRPRLVATTSPGRSVGSLVTSTCANPNKSRPLQVLPATSRWR